MTCATTSSSTWAIRAGVLVVDETGFLKKGSKSAGVARQYSGTAGRIENCQIGVFLAYATAAGRTLLDRELYLPKSWTDDGQRCAEAGIGEDVEFATKPELAMRMLDRALDAGVPAGWVTGDEVYGQHYRLRARLEERAMPYVLAVPVNQRVIATVDGKIRELRADQSIATVSPQAWKKISAGATARRGHGSTTGLACRSVPWTTPARATGCWSAAAWPTPPTWPTTCASARPARRCANSSRVAGARWAIEESLPDRQGRGRPGPVPGPPLRRLVPAHHPRHARPRVPHRHPRPRGKRGAPPPADELIPLTVPEVRRLLARLIWTPDTDPPAIFSWSRWRRRHQARARRCHYAARGAAP